MRSDTKIAFEWTKEQKEGFFDMLASEGGKLLFFESTDTGYVFTITSPDNEPPGWGKRMVEKYVRRLQHYEGS